MEIQQRNPQDAQKIYDEAVKIPAGGNLIDKFKGTMFKIVDKAANKIADVSEFINDNPNSGFIIGGVVLAASVVASCAMRSGMGSVPLNAAWGLLTGAGGATSVVGGLLAIDFGNMISDDIYLKQKMESRYIFNKYTRKQERALERINNINKIRAEREGNIEKRDIDNTQSQYDNSVKIAGGRRLFGLWDYAMLKGLAVSIGMQAALVTSNRAAMAAVLGMASIFTAKIVGIPLVTKIGIWHENARRKNITRRIAESEWRMEEARAKRAAKSSDISSEPQQKTVASKAAPIKSKENSR